MTHHIAFVSIFDLTRAFYAVAAGLAKAGHKIYWITTDPYWTGWLEMQGVDRACICELAYGKSDFLDAAARKDLSEQIVAAEANADLTANQALLMDQFVAAKNKSDISEYVFLYYRDIKKFLIENRITRLIAEPTNTNEMIAYIVCRELGVKYISPREMRYPHGRLIFLDSYLQANIHARRIPANSIDGRALIDDFTMTRPTPGYFKKHNKARVVSAEKMLAAARHRIGRGKLFEQKNLTHHSLGGRVRLLLRRIFNGFYMKHLCRYDRLDRIEGRVAYYGLHVQPESSIDVLGSYFSDQLKLIKDIRRALPFDTTLVVKEHPNFLGTKKLSFFRQLRRVPNVKLLRHNVSAYDIYDRAAIIFTVSGTTAYEAGLMGKPAVIFAPMFFGGLSSIHYCTDLARLRSLVYDLLHNFKRDIEGDSRFMEQLVGKSYDVIWGDPNYYPDVLEGENLVRLREAFLEVITDDND